MLTKLKKLKDDRSSQDFTIIEVMIVLAIAGLILLIVFLAVPALQRNARNTSIKSDAGAVAGGVSTWESNNDGAVPTNITGTGTATITGAAGTTSDTVKVNGSTVVAKVAAAPTGTNPPLGTVDVLFGKTCSGTSSTRATAVYYSTETSGSQQQQCIDT